MTLGGVIYLLSIADKRMKGATRRNLDMFHHLCGNKAFARVVLGTTNWGEVEKDVGLNREKQLVETFSEPMTTSGSKFLRFDKTERSAQVFVDDILGQLKFGGNEILDDNAVRTLMNELDRKFRETAVVLRSMPKQLGAFLKKIKTDDNVMVGGLPTDIVIPCDYPSNFLSHYLPITVLWAQPELVKALYAPRDLESLSSLTTHSSSTLSSGKIPWSSAMIIRLAPPQYNTQLLTIPFGVKAIV